MNTYDINKIQLPNGDICNLRDANAQIIAEYKTLTNQEIATFNDGIQNSTLKNYSIKIEPKQDLHGYDRPWAGSAGKNLLPPNDINVWQVGSINTSGVNFSNDAAIRMRDYLPIDANTQYTFSAFGDTDDCVVFCYDSSKVLVTGGRIPLWSMDSANKHNATFTTPDGTVYYRIRFANANTPGPDSTMSMQLEKGSVATAYEPYSNICPIEGWDEVEVTRTGKNLLVNNVYMQGVLGWNSLNADGITNNIHFISSPYIKIFANTQYTISSFVGNIVRIYVTDENHNTLYFLGNYPTPGTNRIIPATADAYYIRISIGIDDQTITPSDYGTKVYGQLEAGSTATAYEPYSGMAYSITFPTEVGTVYGGSLDVTNGVLTVTDGYIESYNGETLPGEWISDRDVYVVGTLPTMGAQVVYELATSLTYILTANQLTVLLGTNHIWADAGNITITYPTNLKGHIDNINNGCIKKSQQAQTVFYGLATSAGDNTQKSSSNAIGIYTDEAKGYILHMLGLDAIIGNYELDEYADKDYSVDQLFMMKGKLYKATSFIPQGGSIVPNTNCVQTTILENLINQSE